MLSTLSRLEQENKALKADLRRVIENSRGRYFKKASYNWVLVQELIQWGTGESGSTSSIAKCKEIGLDPYSM